MSRVTFGSSLLVVDVSLVIGRPVRDAVVLVGAGEGGQQESAG